MKTVSENTEKGHEPSLVTSHAAQLVQINILHISVWALVPPLEAKEMKDKFRKMQLPV